MMLQQIHSLIGHIVIPLMVSLIYTTGLDYWLGNNASRWNSNSLEGSINHCARISVKLGVSFNSGLVKRESDLG